MIFAKKKTAEEGKNEAHFLMGEAMGLLIA